MLRIARDLVDKIIAHARARPPGRGVRHDRRPGRLDRPERFIPMLNAARSPTFYEFDSTEQIRNKTNLDQYQQQGDCFARAASNVQAHKSACVRRASGIEPVAMTRGTKRMSALYCRGIPVARGIGVEMVVENERGSATGTFEHADNVRPSLTLGVERNLESHVG